MTAVAISYEMLVKVQEVRYGCLPPWRLRSLKLSSPAQLLSNVMILSSSATTISLTVSVHSHIFRHISAHSSILHAVCLRSLSPFHGPLKTGSQSCNE